MTGAPDDPDRETASESPNILIHCRRFHVERIERQIGDKVDVRDVIRHPGSVVLLPIIDEDRICLIRNHRVAVDSTLIELPAGTREPGEPPEETARRELIEETMILYRATELIQGEPKRELGEEIENFVVDRKELRRLIDSGEICDAKTLLGAMIWLAGC
jgi:ADP-ribose pyrophosphatase